MRISPDRRIIVSVGSEGGIFIWGMPPASPSSNAIGNMPAPGEIESAMAIVGEKGVESMAAPTANVYKCIADDLSRLSMSR